MYIVIPGTVIVVLRSVIIMIVGIGYEPYFSLFRIRVFNFQFLAKASYKRKKKIVFGQQANKNKHLLQ